jgi:hypothetical protein
MILEYEILGLLAPEGYYFIDGYMGKFPFVIERQNIIGTGFYISPENVRPTAVNIYILVEIVFHYKRLYHRFSSCLFSLQLAYLPVSLFDDINWWSLHPQMSINCNYPFISYKYI